MLCPQVWLLLTSAVNSIQLFLLTSNKSKGHNLEGQLASSSSTKLPGREVTIAVVLEREASDCSKPLVKKAKIQMSISNTLSTRSRKLKANSISQDLITAALKEARILSPSSLSTMT